MAGQHPASRYFCPNRDKPGSGLGHDSGNGMPPRQKCRGCGGRLSYERGWWGVFAWTGTGRYPLEDAVHVYTFENPADNRAATLNAEHKGGPGGMVVRWIPKGDDK